MAPSIYTPLRTDTPHLNIRLIRLQPSEDPSAPISCELVVYPLISGRPHIYECLSYVWGSPENPRPIQVCTTQGIIDFKATPNLHAALLQLRDAVFERILWVDAICIDQENNDEKAIQVAAMARIYGLASRVVAWLGEEEDQSGLALQELTMRALKNEMTHRASNTDRVEVESDDNASHALRAILSRNYFRRMWILQEVTAARNLVFRCGRIEMQAATFLSGLVKFPTSYSWKLQNRIRIFIQLIRRSKHRERFKGEAHLNIDSLVELTDRFHAHDATDPRDKIYALWGLSSDVSSMQLFQPDYTKNLKYLMEELGKVVFGQETFVMASDDKQVIYLRCPSYNLGEVIEAPKTNMWGAEQDFTIASVRENTYLDTGYTWCQNIRMRTSAEEIRVRDIMLYLPRAKKLVIVRPQEYYFRIVSVIDSEKVMHELGEGSGKHWDFWQPYLNGMAGTVTDFPLLWSWEHDFTNEGPAALKLVEIYHSTLLEQTNDDQTKARSQAEALSEIAFLFSGWDDYESACSRLSAMVDIYSSIYGPEAEITVAGSNRLAAVTKRRVLYQNAKEHLTKQPDIMDSRQLSEREHYYVHIIAHASMGLMPQGIPNEDLLPYMDLLWMANNNPSDVLCNLASKILSRGVSKKIVLDAIRLCTLRWEHVRSTAMQYHQKTGSTSPFTHERLRILPLENNLHSGYLGLLLQMSGDDIILSKRELLEASHAHIGGWELSQLIRRCDTKVDNFTEIIKALEGRQVGDPASPGPAYRELGGDHVKEVLRENSDRVVITSETVLVAANWHLSAVSAVLEAVENPGFYITSTLLDSVLSEWQRTGPRVIEYLIQHMDVEWTISENAFIAFLEAENPRKIQVDDILIALMEEEKVTINITKRIFKTILNFDHTILEFFHFRKDICHIFDSRDIVQWAETMISQPKRHRTGILLSVVDLQESLGPIEYQLPTSFSAENRLDYIRLLNLVRYRRSAITITREMILDAVNHKISQPPKISWNHNEKMWQSRCFVEDFTSCLVKYADQEVIDALEESPTLRNASALRAFPKVIQSLRSRLKNPPQDIQMLSQFAVFHRSMKEDKHLRGYGEQSRVRRDLIKNLGEMLIPADLQQKLLLSAMDLRKSHECSELLGEFIRYSVIRPGIPGELQEAILRLVMERFTDSGCDDLEMLLSHGIIQADALYIGNRTPLHIFIELNGMRNEKCADLLIQYGAMASVDTQDVEGRTPHQMIQEILKENHIPLWADILARLDGVTVGARRNSGQMDESTSSTEEV